MVVLAVLVATLSLVALFISRDFEVAYVALHSELAMPDRFTWVAFYAGNEGSLLFIAFALAVMSALAIWRAPQRLLDTMPYTTAILMVILAFFLAVMGFFVYQGLGALAPELGEGAVTLLQAVLVGAAGALVLYFGLKAVHLTEMANRVWKRAAEFGVILAERRRLGDRETATSPAGEQDTKERQVDHV